MPLDPSTLEQLQTTVRRFVRERLVPLEAQVAREDRIPAEVVQEMRELGLFGLTVPEAYGGLGLNTEEECKVVMELGWTSPAFRSVIGTNNGIGSQGLVMDGTAAQKDHWLPRMASGEVIGSFALTEPDAGSDAGSVRTRADRQDDGFIINGRKRYITNAPHAQLFTVFARTDTNAPGSRGVSAFLVPADSKGLSLGKPDKKMGQQGAHVCDVVFEDVYVPADALLGGEAALHKGFLTAMKTLDRGRLHISALAVGCAQRLIEEATRYAAERQQFGQAIGSSSWCRPCWRIRPRKPTRPEPWSSTPPGAGMRARITKPSPPAANSSLRRWWAELPIEPCRSLGAPATWRNTASSASIGMCACFDSTKARAKSSSSSSPGATKKYKVNYPINHLGH